MALAFTHAPAEKLQAAIQINESKRAAGGRAKPVAIDFLECRAGNDDTVAFAALAQFRADQVKPGPAIFVRQWNALGHFIDIGFRVKLVAFNKSDAQFFRQLLCDRGLARAAHSHHDDCLCHPNL
ncbi:hypothetical protein D3C80_562700 [compost metagenome]